MSITAFSATATNDFITKRKPLLEPDGGDDTVSVRYAIPLTAADVNTTDHGGVIGYLPARCVPVSLVLDTDDLDSGTALVWSVGLGAVDETTGVQTNTAIDTNTISGGAAWVTGNTTSQAGGAVAIVSKALMRVQPSNQDRAILIHATTGAGSSGQIGEIGLTLTYRQYY